MSRLSITSALRRRPRRIIAALLLSAALVPAGVVGLQSASANPSSASKPKPTIVLVHGAWANASSWNGVANELLQRGYTVDVAPNPLRGLTSDTESLVDYLATITGPIVLVGHSYGGAVITDAATGNKNVKALVYDDAYLPDVGENVSTLSTAQSALAPAQTHPETVFKTSNYPGQPAPNVVDTYLLPSVVFNSFAPDVPHAKAQLLALTQDPTSLAALGQPSTAPAWRSIPSWAVVGRQDKIIPEAAQLFMAHRANAHITEINSSHVSLISHPGAVAGVIMTAACATS